jgi:hypothetical protein
VGQGAGVGAGQARARGFGEGLRRARGHRGEEYAHCRAEAEWENRRGLEGGKCEADRTANGREDALFYPGVGDKRVDHEIAGSGICDEPGGGRNGKRAYTWLRERESGERLKASDEGAGMLEQQRSRDLDRIRDVNL